MLSRLFFHWVCVRRQTCSSVGFLLTVSPHKTCKYLPLVPSSCFNFILPRSDKLIMLLASSVAYYSELFFHILCTSLTPSATTVRWPADIDS